MTTLVALSLNLRQYNRNRFTGIACQKRRLRSRNSSFTFFGENNSDVAFFAKNADIIPAGSLCYPLWSIWGMIASAFLREDSCWAFFLINRLPGRLTLFPEITQTGLSIFAASFGTNSSASYLLPSGWVRRNLADPFRRFGITLISVGLPASGIVLSSVSAIFAGQVERLAFCPLPGFPAKQPSMAALPASDLLSSGRSGQSSRRTCDGTSKSPSRKHPPPLRQQLRKDRNSVHLC